MNADRGETGRARHGSFTAELELPAPPGQVFAAYAELPVRRRWFRMPAGPTASTNWVAGRIAADLRVKTDLRDRQGIGAALAAARGAVSGRRDRRPGAGVNGDGRAQA